jgi:purine-binding chemotaxis protein CheW
MDQGEVYLLCRVGTRYCAFPLACVLETMRPLPVEPLVNMPCFVRGVAVIRGEPVPVVDAGTLFGPADGATPRRFVTIRSGDRRVALAVDEVLSVHTLPLAKVQELPPLVRDARAEVVSALGTLDGNLVLVLHAAHLVPEDVWQVLCGGEATT